MSRKPTGNPSGRTATRPSIFMTEGDFQRARTTRMRKYHMANPIPRLFTSAKSRAKKFNLPFTLTHKDIVVPTHCPALGLPLDFSSKECTPTLDRIIPALGYVAGNIAVISWRANRLKSDATSEELQKLRAYVLAKHPPIVLG